MPTTSQLGRVSAVVLRYMRRPMFVLIAVYGVGIGGMALIPGLDADGNPTHMGLFHAFYFFTYTVTTTGFGEIPTVFTDEQRLWAIFCLYMGVIAWLYAIGSIINLMQNPHFVQAVAERAFARRVRRIPTPFFIICGFGDTGSLLARGLSDHHITAVIIDSDSERIKALGLRDYRVPVPGLCADASVPQHLIDAGVKRRLCRGVVALTSDEDTNLKIAVMTRFLNSEVQIICRSMSARHKEHLAALTSVTPIDPFELFAKQLSTRLMAPCLRTLEDWLVGVRGVSLSRHVRIPTGTWILCGYGRMGRWLYRNLTKHRIPTVVIDPDVDVDEVAGASRVIRDYADVKALSAAGIRDAAGIVAGTGNDAANLSILLSAATLNPDAFAIVRQNHHENHLAFDGARADVIMQPSLMTARRVLLLLVSPLTLELLGFLREQDDRCTEDLIGRLEVVTEGEPPNLWRIRINDAEAPAVMELIRKEGATVTVGHLSSNPRDPDGPMLCVPLLMRQGDQSIPLPTNDRPLCEHDEILFSGTLNAEELLEANLHNVHTLECSVTGQDLPTGYVFRWLAKRQRRQRTAME